MPFRVLIADDDPEICTLVATILRGYSMTVCNDAESALVHLRKGEEYDVLISDFMLPGMSGLDLVRQVRGDRRTAKLPIVMISGHNNYANYAMDQRARDAGADAFLNKPFSVSQLRATVAGLVAGPLSKRA